MSLSTMQSWHHEFGDKGAPEWVHLLPLGAALARDGRDFLNDEPEGIIAAFEAAHVDLPIDYDHQSEADGKLRSGPTPVAGWINKLELRTDGIWGRVRWTDQAKAMILRREYRYLSPAMHVAAKSKRVLKLTSAALVHKPALQLTALASQETDMPNETPLLQRLGEVLGLDGDLQPDDIVGKVQALLDGAGQPDPAKFVPIEALRDLLKQHKSTEAEMREVRIAAKVDKAFADGYLAGGSMRDWALELCQTNEAAFDTFIAQSGPVYAALLKETHTFGQPPTDSVSVDDQDAQSVATQLGIDPKKLLT